MGVRKVLVFTLLLYSSSLAAQSKAFVITGKFKIDGGSNSGAQIVVEKDGKKVKTLSGDSKFKVEMDYQAIYIISFAKEGYVTKKLRFDTHVPESRIEYGFEPFDFTIEIFPQYDGVNTIVFNQPVGKIAYSDIIDEFDYDTDYTKSIQTQIEQAMQEVEVKKVEKQQAEAENKKQEEALQKQVVTLTSAGDKNASAGKLTDALKSYEDAVKLRDSPELQKKIEDVKKKIETQQQQQQKEEEFKKLVADAQAAMAAGELEEARKLFEQANQAKAGDSNVKAQLDKVNKMIQDNAQKEQQFTDLAKAAQEAAKAQNWGEVVTKAEQALKIRADPAIEKLKADAQATMAAEGAKQAAEQEKKANYDKLIAAGDKANSSKNYIEAAARYEEAARLIDSPEVQQKIATAKEAQAAIAKAAADEEQRKQKAGQLIEEARASLAKGDLDGARQKANAAGELGNDPRVAELLGQIETEQKKVQTEQKAIQAKEKKYSELIASAQASLDAGEVDKAQVSFKEADVLIPGREEAGAGLAQVEARRNELAAAKKQEEQEAAQKKETFEALITEGQSSLAGGELEAAREAFTKAGQIFQDKRVEKGLKDVEGEMQKRQASAQAEAGKKAQYDKLMAEGASAVAGGELAKAEQAFKGAQLLFDDEPVREKLAEIGRLKEEQAQAKAEQAQLAAGQKAEAERNAEYQRLISEADKFLGNSMWDKAEENYTKALALKKEDYPKNQLQLIVQQREELALAQADRAKQEQEKAAAEQKQKEFESRKIEGDKAFEKGKLDDAEAAYNAAVAIMEDTYVRQQLIKIQEKQRLAGEAALQAEKSAARSIDEKYTAKLGEADQWLDKNELDKAEALYREALDIKSGETYPASKLEEIKTLRAGLQAAAAKQQEEDEKAAAAQEESRKKKEFDALVDRGNKLFQADDLTAAREQFKKALAIQADPGVIEKIGQIDDLLKKRIEEQQKAEEAALALADNRGRESKELASIIMEEEKAEAQTQMPKNVSVSPQVGEDKPKPVKSGPVIISEPKVGKNALNTPSAKLSEDDKFDAMAKRAQEQQEEFKKEKEQGQLKEKYTERKTVETENVGNSTITYIYINRGDFVTVYKKVEHNWGGVFYFIDNRPTNQRFWEHETQ